MLMCIGCSYHRIQTCTRKTTKVAPTGKLLCPEAAPEDVSDHVDIVSMIVESGELSKIERKPRHLAKFVCSILHKRCISFGSWLMFA